MPESLPPEDNTDLLALLAGTATPAPTPSPVVEAAPEPASPDPTVDIPIQDRIEPAHAMLPTMTDNVQAAIEYRARLVREAAEAQLVWSRSSERKQGESDHDHQERIKREFEAAVLAVRRQEDAPPPPPMAVPTAISEQTKREMAAGKKQSEYWAEQAKLRPMPNAKEIQAAGTNTPVFRPGEYMHEKGSVEKHLVSQNTPVR
jgi:hypothetical protein